MAKCSVKECRRPATHHLQVHAKSEHVGSLGARVVVKGVALCVTHAGGVGLVAQIYEEAWRQLRGAFELQGLGRPDRTTLSYRSEWGPPHNSTSMKSQPLGTSATRITDAPAKLGGRRC